MLALLRPAEGGRVSGHRTAQAALDAAGVQLALGLREEERGESVELADVDVDRADRLAAAALERLLAATSRPTPCRCERPLLDRDEWDGALHCVRCGREVAP
jgi:hypothetical protein